MTTRRRFLGSLCSAPLAASPRRPNFLLLLTDDQRFDTIRALGYREAVTPNMDRLVRRGVAFTHAQTQGGLTGAICMPSRAQILTGRTVFEVHRDIVDRQQNPDPAVLTFPEQLRKHGYETFHTGKWHNGPALFQRSFSSGARIFFGGMSDHLQVPVHDYAPGGRYPNENARTGEKFSSELFSDAAIAFLNSRDRSRPFLLSVAYTSPHDPRMAPPRFAALFPPERAALPRNFLPRHPFDNGEMKVRDELLAPFPRTPGEIRRHIAAYYAMIAEVDHHIGRVLDALDRSGDASNTYIVFAGDNGLAVGRHGLLGKQNLYDHSLRVPLVIAGPGIPAGRRNESLCCLMDIAPTICDLAGVPLPTATAARSLATAAATGRLIAREETVSAYRDCQRALRTRDWKLILYNVNGVRTTQLFNLNADPGETLNLASDLRHVKLAAALRETLARTLKQHGDASSWPAGGITPSLPPPPDLPRH
jgi:arylsulfatase A-like enzyme